MSRAPVGLGAGTYVAFLLAVLGAIAWATGTAALLPSLGPSAYVLAAIDDRPRRVVVGQFVGALAAFLAVLAFAGTATPLLDAAAGSTAGLRRIAAALVATVVATVGMTATDSLHPPAYATVLIVSLGIADDALDVVAFGVGVLVLVATHGAVDRLGPWRPPYSL
ncbi:HPP family protein [Halobacterium rubrum]|uniref:HPP family protein n=1 Tax=Halobacterium TaxID=2239 RepID=UPI001F489F75|nr:MULTISPECIES: HPP family protein [Halobacterium]MDH5019395.1 HPP family protein [Halobacterium rubrum]